MMLTNLTMPEFEAALTRTRTVVIPFGSVEEHGSHLPLGTDTWHAREVARRAAAQRPLLVAPPVYYGLCRSTSDHPGTVSISAATVKALAYDIAAALHRLGCQQVIFLTGHAGGTHLAALLEAGEQLLRDWPHIKVAVVNILELLREALGEEPGLVQTPGDSHAGEVETALMLAMRPELVGPPPPAEWPAFPRYILCRDKRKFWPGGVWGDPGAGTGEKGEKMLQAEVRIFLNLVNTLERFED